MDFIGNDPGRKAIAWFLAAILIGAAILSLPMSHADKPVGILDALFTATSAVCVTGLAVVDTGTDYSPFGQVVILILIQLGGLGIMTFATVLISMAGGRLGFRDRLGLTASFGSGLPLRTGALLRAVMFVTFTIELIGALILFLLFSRHHPAAESAWLAAFHSISAFCNAGFSTFPDSLERFAGSAPIILTMAALIILGGLGFAVIMDISHRAAGRTRRLSLHSRICLSASAVLLLFGAIVFFLDEYGNTLTAGPALNLVNAFFQSVTCRTAGFNTLPQAQLNEVSLLTTITLMFIGGCPGSTAGGIKTTTFAIIALTVWARFRGRRSPAAFRRSISQDSILRAVSIFILSVFVVGLMIALLTFVWDQPAALAQSGSDWLVENVFEIVSAFGTVGLSLGATPHLNPFAKIIIIITMFIGRVGLLTLAFSLARPPVAGELRYAEEPVTVG